MPNFITAEKARENVKKHCLEYESSIDHKIFDDIEKHSSKGCTCMDMNRRPTKAEQEKLTELGYRYSYTVCEYGTNHTISWDVPKPSIWSRLYNWIRG